MIDGIEEREGLLELEYDALHRIMDASLNAE
jgi:hypothetical protein